MQARHSVSSLRSRVENLNRILRRPETAYTRQGNTLSANVGHFLLDTWHPGDGWTRYRLAMICNEQGGQIDVSPCCNSQEMSAYLRGIFDVLDSVYMADGGKHIFDKEVR